MSTLEENDIIFISSPDGPLQSFRVYANMLVKPDAMTDLAGIAEQAENPLVLVTCENESIIGEYTDRRVIFAK